MFVAASGSAQTNSPGPNSAHITTAAFTVPGPGEQVVASVTIAKGRPKRVLEVDALLEVYNPADSAVYVLLRANGVLLFGNDAAQDCNGMVACEVVVPGWMDLDAVEAANPGIFIGQPILVEMIAGNSSATVPSATATVRARLQKK